MELASLGAKPVAGLGRARCVVDFDGVSAAGGQVPGAAGPKLGDILANRLAIDVDHFERQRRSDRLQIQRRAAVP